MFGNYFFAIFALLLVIVGELALLVSGEQFNLFGKVVTLFAFVVAGVAMFKGREMEKDGCNDIVISVEGQDEDEPCDGKEN